MGEDGGAGIGCVAAARRQYVTWSPVTRNSAMVLVQGCAGMHTTASPALEYIPPVAFCALRLLLALPFLGYLAHREGGRWFRGYEWAWPVPVGRSHAARGSSLSATSGAALRRASDARWAARVPICTTIRAQRSAWSRWARAKRRSAAPWPSSITDHRRLRRAGCHPRRARRSDAVLLLTRGRGVRGGVVLLTLALKRLDARHRAEEREGPLRLDERESSGKARELLAPPGPMRFLFAATVVAEAGVVGFAAEDLVANIEWASLPPLAWGAVLYAGLASSCLAHGLNSWAISKVQGILPTVYSGAQVVFTVLFGQAFLGHPVGWDRAAGSAVTVFGVYLVSRAKFAERNERSIRRTATNGDANAADAADAKRGPASASDAPASVRVRRASIDHIAVALELGPAEDEREASGGVAKAGGRRLPTVASASELERGG